MIRPASLALLCLAVFATACQREERNTRPDPSLGNGDQPVPVTTLAPGGERPSASDAKAAEFEANAFHLSEGKRLFDWFNCSGCHANGGGGLGAPRIGAKII
jgi:cytochrome c oxidase cbb3-type subunit 3